MTYLVQSGRPTAAMKSKRRGIMGGNQRLWRAIIGENGGGAGRFVGAFSTPAAIFIAELSGKVAIVTGASKGIGAAIARLFAEAGAAVAVNYASSKADADRVVAEIVRKGGKAVAIQADVSKRADVKRLFGETKAKLGSPSILVNNAGVYAFAPLEAVTEEDFHRHFDLRV